MDVSEELSVISDKIKIITCLQEIAEQSLVFTISTSRTDIQNKYKSTIIQLDPNNEKIILRELYPCDWQSFISAEDLVNISCLTKNGEIKFKAQLSTLDNDGDVNRCQLNLPQYINKMQLRSFTRLALNDLESVAILSTNDGAKLRGTCRDFSLLGGLMEVKTNINRIKPGELIYDNRLTVPGFLDITYAAKVCHVQEDIAGKVLIGIKFLDLKVFQLSVIRAAMTKLTQLNASKKSHTTDIH